MMGSFRKKPSLSPSRGRSTSSSPPNQPLSPCLVHRMPSAPSSKHRASPVRRPSLPIYHQPKDSAKTVPLRPCCPDCERITEESLQQGSDWQEQFSRGARRRRSASLDNSMVMSSVLEPGYVTSATHHIEPALISRYPTAGSKFLITVDEVDKRRKSLEVTEDDAKRTRSVSPFRLSTAPSCSRLHPHERDSSGGSSFDDLTVDDARRKPRASPIQEEDEAQLFPLPSPRRSPNSSPASSILLSQSPKASPSPSPSPSQKNTPAPSPNASATFLGDLNDGKLSGSLTRRSVGDVVTSRANEPTVKNEPSMKPVMASVLSRPLSVHELPPSNSTNSVTPMPESVPTPTHSPIMSTKAKTKQRKSSFSLPFIKAGTDALKGVSSMSGGVFGSP